jgi:hypothetical protein
MIWHPGLTEWKEIRHIKKEIGIVVFKMADHNSDLFKAIFTFYLVLYTIEMEDRPLIESEKALLCSFYLAQLLL